MSTTIHATREQLTDRVRGGWVGTLIGGIEGLAHEFKYNEEPRPDLPELEMLPDGARTDDDNDFEWTHLYFMDREGQLLLPHERVVEIWKANMNTGLWVANLRARELMDEGLVPPATGEGAHNQFAWFNLSGQFAVEAYGLIAPGLPRTAAEIGLHYAKIAVSGEPLQATQYWTSLISLATVDDRPLPVLMTEALAAVDEDSAMAEVIHDALGEHAANPVDWKAARRAVDAKWRIERRWNGNSTPTNGGLVALALSYGVGDFYRTLQYAMALGHDTDCNAATAGAVLGAQLGYERVAATPGFRMADRFVNYTRPQLPAETSVSEQVGMLMRVCERAILSQGGEIVNVAGQPGYRYERQPVQNLERLTADARHP